MPSLFKRGRTWHLQFYDQDRSPSRKQVSLQTSTKRTANRLLAELEDLYLRGLYDPWTDDFREALERTKRPDKPTEAVDLGDARQRFLASKQGLSQATRRMYALVTRLFHEELGEKRVGDLTAQDVTSFLAAGDLSLTSKHTYLRHLRVFVRWCVAQGWMEDITRQVSLRRKPEKKLKAFTKAEVGKLVQAAEEHVRTLVILGAYTGLRRSELSNLKWEAVDLAKKEVHVVGQTKSGKHRTVPLSPKPIIRLNEIQVERGYVLHTDSPKRPVHPDTLTHDFLSLRRSVLPEKKEHSLHSLRHTFCTWLAEGGVPIHSIMQLAGHASIDTTMQYVHAMSDGKSHIERVFGSPLKKSADAAEVLS